MAYKDSPKDTIKDAWKKTSLLFWYSTKISKDSSYDEPKEASENRKQIIN